MGCASNVKATPLTETLMFSIVTVDFFGADLIAATASLLSLSDVTVIEGLPETVKSKLKTLALRS